MNRAEQIQEVIESIGRCQRTISPVAWQKSGLSRAQVGMLYMLHYHQGSSMKFLAKHLDISKSAVTQLVEPLIEKDLVSRQTDPKDRRTAILALSIKGRKTITKFNQIKSQGIRSALATLSDKELINLSRLHQKMAHNINNQ